MEVEVATFIKNMLEPSDPLKVIRLEKGEQLKVILPSQRLNLVCQALKDTEPYYFLHLTDITVSPENSGAKNKSREVVWHLYSHKLDYRLNLAVKAEKSERFPDLAAIWSSAGWLQQRCLELHDINFYDDDNARQPVYTSGYSSKFKKFESESRSEPDVNNPVEQKN